ncbi:MAG: Peptidase, partial [Pseudonocardia sp.]|nr:Peptidase [Pseudonocardia sp.]
VGPPPPRRGRRLLVAAIAALAVLGGTIGAGLASAGSHTITGSAQPVAQQPVATPNGSSATATAAQQVGVVDINTDLKYANAQAAGTGMILTSSGAVLTNNHVVEGATSITVTVVSTGQSFDATVVGTDATDDVAVLQMAGASNLDPVHMGDSGSVAVGDQITAVGNAGGKGGAPHAATGNVVALGQSITASDQAGRSEQLTGMIQINAQIQPGDSGGPLYNAAGDVIGMDTAASATGRTSAPTAPGRQRTTATEAFAIPISRAQSIAGQIQAGQSSSTVHIGQSAFLGVQVQASGPASGAVVASTIPGGPAAGAGIVAGDVITAVDGRAVDSTSLSTVMQGYHPGDQVRVAWTDASGRAHTATVSLTAGPAR